MIALWYVGFCILLALPIAALLSNHTEDSFGGKLAALVIGIIIVHLIGFTLGFIDYGSITITVPGWMMYGV